MLTIFRRGQRVFGYPRGSGEVCEIDPGFIMQFAKDTADYREHRVAPFYSFDVKEFTFTGSGGRKANLKRGDDSRWHGTDQGIERPVDGEKVNEFLTILQDLEADSFMDHPEGGESFSINLEIQISGHGPQPEVIHLSFSRFHGEGILVKNRDLPYLFKLSGDFPRKLSQRVEDFFR